jgi:hypothetical protein
MSRQDNKPKFRETQAVVKSEVREWLMGYQQHSINLDPLNFKFSKVGENVSYYKVDHNRQATRLSRELIAQMAMKASIDAANWHGGAEYELTRSTLGDLMAQFEADCERSKHKIEEPQPLGFANDEGYCYYRLPIPRMPAAAYTASDYSVLGPFLNGIRTRMRDYDPETDTSRMFTRLMTAVGALLWGSEPSREIIYWHGLGGDGKTTFCNFLATKMGVTALTNLKPSALSNEYYLAELEGKRLVVAEEAGAGHFLTEPIKAITGNRYITGRAPYKPIRTFRSHVMIWFTSNKMPVIDGEASSIDRLRLISSTPPPKCDWRPESDIFEELDLYWPHIVDFAIGAYHAAGGKVLPMTLDELDEPVGYHFLDADGFIEANLIYEKGAFISTASIKYIARRDRISIRTIESRLAAFLQPPAVDAADGRVEKRRRRISSEQNAVWGYQNVALAIGHPDIGRVMFISGPNRNVNRHKDPEERL